MSNKYIIKNCPNLTTSYYGTGETIHNQCGLTDDDLCINCTDCVIKQIVELAKGYKEELIDRKTKKTVATRYFPLTKDILELLGIEEIK